jgi:hypothetical protein
MLVIAACAFVGTVQAQSLNWAYAEGGWATVDPDRGSREDGWYLGGAFPLGKVPIHVFGEFGDYGQIDIWQVGAGWHGALGKPADLFADAAIYDTDVDDGLKVRGGVRWMLTKRLELNGYLAFTHLDIRDNNSIAGNVLFSFAKRFAVGGGVEWGDEWTFARAFVRFNLGPQS